MSVSKSTLKTAQIALKAVLLNEQSLTARLRITAALNDVTQELCRLHISICKDWCCENKPHHLKSWNVFRAPGQYASYGYYPLKFHTLQEMHKAIAHIYGEL